MNTCEFLNEIYKGCDAGFITLTVLPSRNTKWFKVSEIEKVAKIAEDIGKKTNVFFGVGLRNKVLKNGLRGSEKDISCMTALYADIDVKGSAHSQKDLPETIDEIIEVMNPLSEETDYIINYYTKRIDEVTNKKVIAVEVYDKEQTFYYIIKDNKLISDMSKVVNPRPHKLWREIENDDIKIKGDKFGVIPFFRLDNNEDKYSDLRPIKALIDDYDLMSCGLSNNLQDVAEGIYVVKGFQGNDFNELQNNIRVKKMVGVGELGQCQ